MSINVYKTEQGRNIVESYYKKFLTNYSSHPFEQLFIATEAGVTHVLRFGDKSKTPLIMIHGTASNSAVWLGIISDFIDHFCIYCVDIPGEPGLSEPIRITLASEMPYKWFSSLLDNLNINKAALITISLGSWYAMNFAIRNPEKVIALSMLTTGGIVPAKRSFIFKALFFMLLGKAGQKMLNKAIFHKTKIPSEVLEFQSIVSKYFNPVLEVLPLFSDTRIKSINFPLQYFGGDHDALIDSVKTGERLKRLLPHSEIHILKDTGHAIIDQFPVIKDFMKSK